MVTTICRLPMTLSCPMNLRYYPFDKQSCSILIMSCEYFFRVWTQGVSQGTIHTSLDCHVTVVINLQRK